jgi:heavy metal sensor kinase
MAGESVEDDLAALRSYRWKLIGAGTVVLFIGLAIGWGIIALAIRPVTEISAAAVRISKGDLSERIRIADPDTELGSLATVLNTTFSRLEAAFARQQQFTADAAHELHTPLAVLISEAQTALSRERSAAEYRDTVSGALETGQQMRRLTETLLALARIDGGDSTLTQARVDLAVATMSVVERLRCEASERGVEMRCALDSAVVSAVPECINQMITNLLTNAIYYNRRGGEVMASTRIEDGWAVLEVRDTGTGIGAEHLPRIFDRFYRADKGRSRADGRVCLGLAICKSIVDAQQGTISVDSTEGKGTSFTLRLRRIA